MLNSLLSFGRLNMLLCILKFLSRVYIITHLIVKDRNLQTKNNNPLILGKKKKNFFLSITIH